MIVPFTKKERIARAAEVEKARLLFLELGTQYAAAKHSGITQSVISLMVQIAKSPQIHQMVLEGEVSMKRALVMARTQKLYWEPRSKRDHSLANANRTRLGFFFGQLQAMADALDAIDLEKGTSGFNAATFHEWAMLLNSSVTLLNKLNHKLITLQKLKEENYEGQE